MSDAPQTPDPAAAKPGWLVRAFLIILPVGLAFMVPVSLVIYYQKKHEDKPEASQYASMLRRDLNADDFARYVRILSQDIGERSMEKPENLDAAASFVESTMGYDNMGYAVQRQAFDLRGKPVVNLVAELPGQSKPDELVLVVADYDGANANGISALMCVAHAMTSTSHARTIRFAALMNGRAEDAAESGLTHLAQREEAVGKDASKTTIISLSSALAPSLALWKYGEVRDQSGLIRPAPSEVLASLEGILAEVSKHADAP